jgi:hypothetical protein
VEWLRNEPLIKRIAIPVALFAAVRDEWISYGLSTEPADRAAAEAGVMAVYRAAGLEPPGSWCGSVRHSPV